MSAELMRVEPVVFSSAAGVEFLWRGRVTRADRRLGERWWRWCLDDWDNCVDPGWLADRASGGDLTGGAAPAG
jgi:hypothetical protein